MSHPYSGAASYIYALNRRSTLGNEAVVMSNEYPYQNTQWIAVAPPTSVSQKMKPLSPIPHYNSADSPSPFVADIPSHKFEIFSTPSYGTSALNSQSTKAESPAFVYKSIMITFDAPSENVVTWRRQMRRLLKQFRRGISKIFTPSWINTPHPRLSMIQ